jgi:hypothetical protein
MTKRPVGLDETLLPGTQVHARRFDDEVVVLDLAGGDYYALNAVGARVWEQIVDGKTPAEIASVLESEFDVQQERALQDCMVLLEELIDRGLLRRRT